MNAKRLFEHTFTPINTLRGEMDKRQIRKQGCVGASEERAHDSDVTDEISGLAGLAQTPSWRSAAGPHMHAGALGGGERRPVAPHSPCYPLIWPRVRVRVHVKL